MTRSTHLPRTTRTASARWAVAAVAVAAALTLSGCANGDEPGAAASTDTSMSPSASATPSPSPSASPVDQTTAPVEPTNGTVTIAAPADGATVNGPQVDVTGEGTAFEGNLRWQALTAGTTDVVQEGFTTAGANGTVGPFSFTVELTPGTYTLEVWEPGTSDAGGEGATDGRLGLVTSTFTVS
ncbi:MAG: Gmad2 immunoglobulin-like domain-containing protein [Cellulomonas sp.]